jgi:hypothetical protein
MKKITVTTAILFTTLSFAQLYTPKGGTEETEDTRKGNVGIGNSNPQAKLHIISEDAENSVIIGNSEESNLIIGTASLQSVNSETFSINPTGTNVIINQTNGYTGIGTTSPDEKLTVKGKIHAEEVRVDLNVPADYVFEKYYTGNSELKADYTMPTLAEVEKYTRENNHLPNIPSAKEIKEKGLQVGEMSNLLLQKIEELTLYTIEQQKRIEALEKQIRQAK